MLFSCFYHHFVHNYFESPFHFNKTLQKRQICLRENDLVTNVCFFLMESRADSQKYVVDRQSGSYFIVSLGKGKHSLSEITNCSSSQIYHLNIMCPRLNILLFSLKLFELPVSEVLTVDLQYIFSFFNLHISVFTHLGVFFFHSLIFLGLVLFVAFHSSISVRE